MLLLFVFPATTLMAQQSELNKYVNCGEDRQSMVLAKWLIESDGQQRQELTCNKTLSLVALDKAKAMAKDGRVAHNINNTTPNQLLRMAGISLPKIYEITGNQVEAVSGGKKTAIETFDYFMTSPDHKAHLMGENSFYLKQNTIGVGHYYDVNTSHMDYWVVYITALNDKNEKTNTFNVNFVVETNKEKKKPKQNFKKGNSEHWVKFKK